MNIRIFDSAKLDLLDGYYFYESQEEGVGEYFLGCLYSDIDSLRLYAGIHEKKFGFYWMLSKRFPYAIYYEKIENQVSVYAIMDCRQNPDSIAQRLIEESNKIV